jgi:hypothetical protein
VHNQWLFTSIGGVFDVKHKYICSVSFQSAINKIKTKRELTKSKLDRQSHYKQTFYGTNRKNGSQKEMAGLHLYTKYHKAVML